MAERKITTAIFDVGGVLIDQHPDAQNKAVIRAAGLKTPEEQQQYYELWHGQGLSKQYHRGIITNLDAASEFLDLTDIDLLRARQPDDSPLVTVTRSMTPKNDVLAVVPRLLHVGITPVVLSNSMEAGDVLRERGVYDNFAEEHLVFSHKVHMLKPEREIFEHALERSGAEHPSHAVFWDDRQENIDAANEVGINARLFENEDADRILADLRELGVTLN